MNNKYWNIFKQHYSRLFDADDELIEKIAVLDILKYCAYGYSSNKIAGYMGFNVEYIEEVLLDYFGFAGWYRDLDFSPISLYKRSSGNKLLYEQEITMISGFPDTKLINKSMAICKKYLEIKEEVDGYYNRVA